MNEDRTRSHYRRYPGVHALNGLIDRFDRLALGRLFKARDPKPSPETLGRFAELYREDVGELAREWGLDVSGWLRQGEGAEKPAPRAPVA